MRNGEARKVGNATIVCHVARHSWYVSRDDAWMGSRMRPRMSASHTFYSVFADPDDRTVATGVKGYKNAVRIAESVGRRGP